MHRWSQLFIPTLREAPADAEVASHKFLVRAGYIRQLAAGIYSYLFLGQRSFNKISGIVREEMDRIGQEFYLAALHPRELWEVSGRWSRLSTSTISARRPAMAGELPPSAARPVSPSYPAASRRPVLSRLQSPRPQRPRSRPPNAKSDGSSTRSATTASPVRSRTHR